MNERMRIILRWRRKRAVVRTFRTRTRSFTLWRLTKNALAMEAGNEIELRIYQSEVPEGLCALFNCKTSTSVAKIYIPLLCDKPSPHEQLVALQTHLALCSDL